MLSELRVRQLGVIEDESLVLGAGMTVLTGETGAGKTLVVGAIDLLVGGRVDPVLVRAGADEAIVEGRFVGTGGDDAPDTVLARVVPASGRARAYLDGRMASSAALADAATGLLDIHGQHAHQSLLVPAAQRQALDLAGRVDLAPLRAARAEERRLRDELAAIGGDDRARAREADLLRFQLAELVAAEVDDPAEDEQLTAEEERLADAGAHRAAAFVVHDTLAGEGGVADRIGDAVAGLSGRSPLHSIDTRLRSVLAELADVADAARHTGESIEEDQERLVAVGDRRHLLADLRRKYGDTLAEVMTYRADVADRLDRIERRHERAAALDADAAEAATRRSGAERSVHDARRRAAGPLAAAVEARLRDLALPGARFEIHVGDDAPGDDVEWRLAANPGEALLPLRRVASGGELARTMLAARLVVGDVDGPDGARTLVFDEVDAGIGGEAAVAVGAALAELGRTHQVIVVTHLAQVAAFADHHLVVTKAVEGQRTLAGVAPVAGDDRVTELARMLSGRPDSATGRRHAEELLAPRGRVATASRAGAAS